jgi:hypothetical protein
MVKLKQAHARAVSADDLKEIAERAESCREGIEHILRASRTMMTLLQNGQPVLCRELSGVITQAEEIQLVNRRGMALSGLRYAVHEAELTRKGGNVSAEDGMTAVYHLYLQAQRAHNILNHTGGYRPRDHEQLYGSAVETAWKPLLP